MDSRPALSVILPVLNEAEVLSQTVAALRSALGGLVEGLEILVVDDASSDGTEQVCQGLAAQGLRCLRLPFRHGKEASLRLGLAAARGINVAVLDGDLQHPPETLAAMWRRLAQGDVQVVHGQKRLGPMPSATERYTELFHRMHRVKGRTVHGDFKLLGPQALEALRRGTRCLYFRNAVAELDLPFARVEYQVPPRRLGRSKWGGLRLLGFAAGLAADASPAPLLWAALAGALLASPLALGLAFLLAGFPGLPWWLGPMLAAVFLSDGATLGVVAMNLGRQRIRRAISPPGAASGGPGPAATARPH